MKSISIPRGIWRFELRDAEGHVKYERRIEAEWPTEDEMKDDGDDYLAECQRAAMEKLLFFANLDSNSAQEFIDAVETLIDVRLARLGLIPPQPPRRSLA